MGLRWCLVITLLKGHSDRHRLEGDTFISCLLALRLSCGIIHECTEIITCRHSRAPAGKARTLLWVGTNQWEKWTSGFKGHLCLDFRNTVWLCELNGKPCAFEGDIGFFRKGILMPLGKSITAPGWVIYPGWLSQWSYRYRSPHRTKMSNELQAYVRKMLYRHAPQ